MMKLRTNLQQLNNDQKAPFSDDTIHNYGTYIRENNIYLQHKVDRHVEDIPIDKIVGIDQMYGDGTWGECLEGSWLKRLERNLTELSDKPNYYLTDTAKDGISFIKIGDMYFIKQGKHRTIIARFLAHFNPDHFTNVSPLRNVEVTEYFIDQEYLEMKAKIEEVAAQYPDLEFRLNHTTATDDHSFLLVTGRNSVLSMESFTRDQFNHVIAGLTDPRLNEKWASDRTRPTSNIYAFISYSKCLKSLYQQAREALGR
ncbi:hypothetical protein L1D14_03795 [Vibrio tubiashii]|uniref:hypothetical protein n=1 Tax=Vibrio tubiashii TaxID=29498 RepID=UPI001EFEBFA9|nr:hypothetical protein [Vibrio tubiashii]MCG9575353.1 hypothetical protein [Vibrio tubiashii]